MDSLDFRAQERILVKEVGEVYNVLKVKLEKLRRVRENIRVGHKLINSNIINTKSGVVPAEHAHRNSISQVPANLLPVKNFHLPVSSVSNTQSIRNRVHNILPVSHKAFSRHK
jgi:hypothetical protein